MISRPAIFYEELASKNNALARLFPRLSTDSTIMTSNLFTQVCHQKSVVLKNEAGPEAQLQNNKFSAPKSNPQTVGVFEQPDSMKNWHLETMPSQDCFLKLQGIQKKIEPNAPKSNPQAVWVFEEPDSMKNWQSEIMPSQDCSPKLSGIQKMTCPVSRHPSPATKMMCYSKLKRTSSQILWRTGV